ncbi:helix-turn-helix transcriptional regulator [Desemzia sp. RIT804]|uniref:helix-turn-helix domain-containing protein n=1 Tax=Desemzia sp. RIT 804 TaxID=2810209 RepID=UPI00195068F8|nr:helix-turn-helix transcriptional regulator [Desemzia sp. RIT 804]MBM6613848.1 helix-turn-helix transcriptional regulator [Desemzia sp. RIT 804]
MEIGKKIKQRRNELGITQDNLADRINVARSTISNWEIGRNYPDIQTIVLLSDELDISLDELLKGDKIVVEKIANDTKVRKKNKWLIGILSFIVLMVSSVTIWMILGQPGRIHTLSDREQLESFTLEKTSSGYALEVGIKDLPAYRELSLYSLNGSENGSTVSLMLSTDLNLLFDQNNEKIEISLENSFAPEADMLELVDDQGNTFYTIESPENN